jgi:thiol-disulfide isomerase/thioredoxin
MRVAEKPSFALFAGRRGFEARSKLVVVVALTAISGCTEKRSAADAAPSPAPRALSWYRFEAHATEQDRVPFLVGVDPERPRAVIDAGNEQLELVVLSRDPLVLRIPVRGIGLAFRKAGAGGRMSGTWQASYYMKQDFDLTAEPIEGPRIDLLFPGAEPPAVDLSGTWRIDIKDFGVGRAIFKQDAAGRLTGTIIPPEVGDLRHLLGRVIGSRAELSVFDGIHGFHITMSAKESGKQLEGRWVISGIGIFPFTATRAKPPETHLTVAARMAPGKTRLTLPELDKPPYKGNPVIIDYFGSWCPVCMDLTPQLVRLQKEHAKAGLQILSIALEPPGEEAEIEKRLDEFRAQFGVTWPFTIRYTDDFNSQVPPEVLDATGFPVTIFVRRDGTVAGVHTGFISDAASEERAAIIRRFDELTAEIVRAPGQ